MKNKIVKQAIEEGIKKGIEFGVYFLLAGLSLQLLMWAVPAVMTGSIISKITMDKVI